MSKIIEKINQEQVKKEVTAFNVGDTIKVHTRVVEGDKERIQIFAGIVIARKGSRHQRGLHRAQDFLW
jgi:large subunit ribosomal protein L19